MTLQTDPASPCVLVIFGAAGDLTKRLLVPALYNLERAKLLSNTFAVIGIARGAMDDDAFRRQMDAALAECADATATADRERLIQHMH